MRTRICSLLLALSLPMASTAVAKSQEVRPEMEGALDRQVQELLEAVRGKSLGFLTNPTSVDAKYNHLADILTADPEVSVAAFFGPEHGIRGDHQAGGGVADYVDPHTGIPVYSLYGARAAPTAEQLEGLDAVLYDIQDVGSRFYTYVWTMTLTMEAAAEHDIEFFVFDRPNPVGLTRVEGAPNPQNYGRIGRKWPDAPFGVATRHGMTAGEIATLVNEEWMDPKVKLTVIKVPGYTRDMGFTETGYPWVMPSPNMPTLETAEVYPGWCVFEGSHISEGRGTTRPFELIGAPFIHGKEYADALNARNLPGVRFRQAAFIPTFSRHAGEPCNGIQVHVTDSEAFDPIRTALTALEVLVQMYPDEVTFTGSGSRLMGVPNLEERIREESADSIIAGWQETLQQFKELRAKHLLYPENNTGSQWRAE